MSDVVGTAVVSKAENWLRQPTTINGIGTLSGALVGGLIQVLFHEATFSTVGGAFVMGLVHLVMNDNTASPPGSAS